MKAVTSAVIALIALSLIMLAVLIPAPAADNRAGAAVKVNTKSGHGSGVSIGNGYILSAYHVVGDAKKVSLLLDDGAETEADVLWVNKRHDVALLHTDSAELMQSSVLTCEDAQPGQLIKASGNPADLEFISTWGRVGGLAREYGPWASVFVMDMTVFKGMSGGPVYDAAGKVVGLTVGIMVSGTPFSPSFIPFTYAVPSSVICHLMGRTDS